MKKRGRGEAEQAEEDQREEENEEGSCGVYTFKTQITPRSCIPVKFRRSEYKVLKKLGVL